MALLLAATTLALGTGAQATGTARRSLTTVEILLKEWDQCGGEGHMGPIRCAAGLKCEPRDKHHSQCVVDPEALKLHLGRRASTDLSPAKAYDQCGGEGWTGTTTCQPGLVCSNLLNGEVNSHFSQCVPDPDAHDVVHPDPIAIYQKCGGRGYEGNTLCAYGLMCQPDSEWHSQCVADPAFAGQVEPTSALFGQCGGVTWAGATKCEYGLRCEYKDPHYSQCVLDESKEEQVTVPVQAYKQCGGLGYAGPRKCEFAHVCKAITADYWQCEPDPDATGEVVLRKAYEQCGGITYKGPTQCERGYKCLGDDVHYKQCMPDPDVEPLPTLPPANEWEKCGGKDHAGPFQCAYSLKCVSKDPYYSQCEPDPTFLEQVPVEAYGKCGGEGYEGSTRCVDGFICVRKGVWHSACEALAAPRHGFEAAQA